MQEDEAGGLRTREKKNEDLEAPDEWRERGAENEKQLTT